MSSTDVIVVGAGPVGLALAGELRLGGVGVVVLERREEPSLESRGLGFTARTTEVFQQRGLLERFGDVEISTHGHFGGIPFDFSVLEGSHFGVRNVAQHRTERVLEDWATGLGADVRRGSTLVCVDDLGDGVVAEVDGPSGRTRLQAGYLVGCDGGHSTVRRLGGFDFPGEDATREMFLADVVGQRIRPRFIGEKVPGGMVMAAPLADDVDRIIVCEQGAAPRRRSSPPPWEEVASAWQRLTGEDLHGARATWISSFSDAARQVSEYRRGRVLVAGDAAHIHLPAGGQGLSVGVQDAVNLGWKLAAVEQGWAPEGLLDTYHSERHPAGAKVLRNTRAQGLLYLSGSEIEPLRQVVSRLMEVPAVGRHLSGAVSGLDLRYDVGPGDHPLLGRRLPDLPLGARAGSATALSLLHRARGVLISPDPTIRRAAEGWSDRIDLVDARLEPADGWPGGTEALAVRPDGYVTWAAPAGGDPGLGLLRWFGTPRRLHTGPERPLAGVAPGRRSNV